MQVAATATVTQNDCAESIVVQRFWPPISTGAAASVIPSGLPPVCSAVMGCSGRSNGAGDEARHLLRRAHACGLIGDLVPAAQHGDAVGDGEDVGHAVTDQQ